jgi:hypothetical protein
MNQNDAEQIAVAALAHIASSETLLPRFLALTGIEARQIRHAASEPGFLAGVLHFISANEPTLTAFASEAGIKPEQIEKARRALPGGEDRYDSST